MGQRSGIRCNTIAAAFLIDLPGRVEKFDQLVAGRIDDVLIKQIRTQCARSKAFKSAT
jgi:hypothetical protein